MPAVNYSHREGRKAAGHQGRLATHARQTYKKELYKKIMKSNNLFRSNLLRVVKKTLIQELQNEKLHFKKGKCNLHCMRKTNIILARHIIHNIEFSFISKIDSLITQRGIIFKKLPPYLLNLVFWQKTFD